MVQKKKAAKKKDPVRVKAGKHSKGKGKGGEREVADLFRSEGFVARRGQQYKGGEDSPDVITPDKSLHVEVKRTESFNLYKALEQAEADRKSGQAPVIFHRKNKKPWVAIMDANDFFSLLQYKYGYEKACGFPMPIRGD